MYKIRLMGCCLLLMMCKSLLGSETVNQQDTEGQVPPVSSSLKRPRPSDNTQPTQEQFFF